MTEELIITTEDGKQVKNGDRVFSHYTCTWGVISDAKVWGRGGDVLTDPKIDIWFDFTDDNGKRDLLNGERIATYKPAWMDR